MGHQYENAPIWTSSVKTPTLDSDLKHLFLYSGLNCEELKSRILLSS